MLENINVIKVMDFLILIFECHILASIFIVYTVTSFCEFFSNNNVAIKEFALKQPFDPFRKYLMFWLPEV